MRRTLIIVLLTVVSLTTGKLLTTPPVYATSEKIESVESYSHKQSMLVSSNRHTYVWNVKHTKVEYDLREHPTINLYATKKVSLSLNSSPAENYYYVQNYTHKIHGYVLAKLLIAGRYIKGGYYSYPTKGILLSTISYPDDTNKAGAQSAYPLNGWKTSSSLRPFARMPSIKQMITVLKFFNNNSKNHNLSIGLRWRSNPGVRIVFKTINQPHVTVRMPVLQLYAGSKEDPYWDTRANFWEASDLVKSKAIPTTNFGKESYFAVNYGLEYRFPDTSAQHSLQTYLRDMEQIKRIYSSGLGANHNLSLVDLNGWLRYVVTDDIFYIPANKPVLKDDIWYGTQDPSSPLGEKWIIKRQRTLLKSLNPTISNIYRRIFNNGFTQFQYQNGKWQQQFEVSLQDSTSPDVAVRLYTPSSPVSDLEQPYTMIPPTSEATKALLYKPTSYFEKILSNR